MQNETNTVHPAMQALLEDGLTGLPEALRILGNMAMLIEREQALRAKPYERSEDRVGYANGFKPKTVNTRVGAVEFAIPQTRGVAFYPSVLEKGLRSERALTLAMAQMYVQGVSTRKVTNILEKLCGLEITSEQVSRCTGELSAQLEAWRGRPLGRYTHLVFDAIYEKVRQEGRVQACAVLICVGINDVGHREILGVSTKVSEAEVHWREFFEALVRRGLHGVQYIVSDAHAGLQAALRAVFASVPWQRCQFHFQQNALAYVTKQNERTEVASDIRTVFNSRSIDEAHANLKSVAQKYRDGMPKLSAFLEEHCPECFTVFMLPPEHRIKMRTSNALERLNREIRRRTRVATIFPNEASLLLLVSAVLVEISDEWASFQLYLKPKSLYLSNPFYRKNVA